jgi:hypothetical protein
MQVTDVVKLLEGYGFLHLSPISVEKNVFTLKFGSHKYPLLVKAFGKPAVAGGGKVAVFTFPGYGRLGVSPSNSIVRLIYEGNHAKIEHHDAHLAKLDIPPELRTLFLKAQVTPRFRLRYLEDAFTFFNRDRFHGRLPKTKITMSATHPRLPGISQGTRAFFVASGAKSYYWFRERLFNASVDFVNEVVVHEMCHQMTYLDLGYVETEENGHGPVWQRWMRKVGLDPRRFDPTEDYAYMDSVEKGEQEEDLTRQFGPRTPVSFFSKLEPASQFMGNAHQYVLKTKGRAFIGTFTKKGTSFVFKGVGPNKKRTQWVLKRWMPNSIWIKP